MGEGNYYVNLFTGRTWEEFVANGAAVTGFNDHPRTRAKKLKVGDRLLCYLTGVSRFVGVLAVASEPFHDDSPIWQDSLYPLRVKVEPLVMLTPETAVPIKDLKDRLSIFESSKTMWQGTLRASPTRWTKPDGDAVLAALEDARANPVVRPTNPKLLYPKTKSYPTAEGDTVTVPSDETVDDHVPSPEVVQPKEASLHTEIQFLLLKLGQDLGLDLWVANNDRNREFDGKALGSFNNMRPSLPLQFDQVTMKTIELIDVLWLQGDAIVAAFEVESTTSIYSGLLRMSDLLSMQPNLQIPLYIVAPDERREKVRAEVNRPTFYKSLKKPLFETCRYISFTTLKDKLEAAGDLVHYMKPDFLDELSESCETV